MTTPAPEDPRTVLSPLAPSQDKRSLPPRTLVLCFDGTANQFADDKNTNVVHIFQMLKRDDPERQLVYYQTGIGTYTPPGFASKIVSAIARGLDQAFAWYLEEHVLGGYRFLMGTYRPGDKICLFGFSRGAYTARALAGMLYRVGLLPMANIELVPFAYKIFSESGKEGALKAKEPKNPKAYLSRNFRSTFSREVQIEFVGIWDTVSSVGLIPRSLPNTATNPIVRHVRHAISLDERRAKFKSNPWSVPKDSATQAPSGPATDQNGSPSVAPSVEEVWFAGGHGDIGGGWVPYSERAALSRIPLRWMVREATQASSIVWNETFLTQFRVRKPEKTDLKGMEEYIKGEKADALSKFHSAFSVFNLWWIMELIPFWYPVVEKGKWTKKFRWNRWRARTPREPTSDHPTKVHSSVKTRLQFSDYRNAAQWDKSKTKFVDEWAAPVGVM